MTELGQTSIIPKPEVFGHWGGIPVLNHMFQKDSAEVAIICPDI